MNLQTLRDYIRVQLDMDEEELPNALLDSYLNEAFLRTISMENHWPFYETRWNVAAIDENIALPADVDPSGIASLDRPNQRLPADAGRQRPRRRLASSACWSTPSTRCTTPIYGGTPSSCGPPHPTTSPATTHCAANDSPLDWQAAGAGAVPDCDVRLHQLLAHYAIALCYAQQEDEVLEDVYMKRWQASYIAAHSAICQPRHHRPLVLNGGLMRGVAYNPVLWGPPVHS